MGIKRALRVFHRRAMEGISIVVWIAWDEAWCEGFGMGSSSRNFGKLLSGSFSDVSLESAVSGGIALDKAG